MTPPRPDPRSPTALAHLSREVSAPANDAVDAVELRHERTRVVVAGRQRVQRPAHRQGDGLEAVAHLGGRDPPRDGVALPELPEVILAPALDVHVVEDCAGVVSARGHLDGGPARSEVDRFLAGRDMTRHPSRDMIDSHHTQEGTRERERDGERNSQTRKHTHEHTNTQTEVRHQPQRYV